MSFHNRSDALIELLDKLSEEDLEYVLVGGYAVSAFNARFSTDLRDVLAVAEEIALDWVTAHLRRGDDDALREQLERGLEILGSEELKHGYRSDFGASAVSAETVSSLQEYLSSQVDQLS